MKKHRILYVDDEENPLVIAKTYLERIDSEMLVNVLSSPEEALNIYHTYQCIITDYKMPKMDGFELAKRIRNESNIPIILYTGWGDDELFEKAKTLGINECVSKGFDRKHYETLAQKIRELIENN
jgi:two-component system response regulator HydG